MRFEAGVQPADEFRLCISILQAGQRDQEAFLSLGVLFPLPSPFQLRNAVERVVQLPDSQSEVIASVGILPFGVRIEKRPHKCGIAMFIDFADGPRANVNVIVVKGSHTCI